MVKSDKRQYWFKTKKYGWGWGLPANSKGWIAFLVFITIWLIALLTLLASDTEAPTTGAIALFVAIVAADIAALLYISFKYGEPPKWRWGGKTREQRKAAKSKSD